MGAIVVFIVKYEIVGEDSVCNNRKNLLFNSNIKKMRRTSKNNNRKEMRGIEEIQV